MAENSKIEWCHHTANLWWGCTAVHEGCDNCYAEALDNRWSAKESGNTHWGNDKPRRGIYSVWKDLAKYQKLAQEKGEMHRVFVGSMMDIFEKPMPVVDIRGLPVYVNHDKTMRLDTGLLRDELFGEISLGKYENLMFLFLTKRPSNINKYIPEHWKTNPPDNVMFGTSPVNQKTADTLIPQLLQVNGKKFLSIEPQLDFINIKGHLLSGINPGACGSCGETHGFTRCPNYGGIARESDKGCKEFERVHYAIDWVICGGESGPKKRPFNADWARILREQCHNAAVPFFMKQIDKVQPIPEDLLIREFPKIQVPA